MKKVLPASVGPYRILEELGEGGMAVVYLAQQEQPFRRRVALKVIKLGMDTREVIARFESERQALALMDHPHIAKVFDAGSTEQGRPYFLMEYVAGIPITEYCDRHQLSVPERLELFRLTCQAIHHAHQKGIIHRDIKPSNVLVTEVEGEGLPKVIDFGIAKATNQRLTEKTLFTQQGAFIGTPEYMSPEQAETGGLEVDTTTDVYSLGVLLHELLVGTLPLDLRGLGSSQIERTIRGEEPRKLTTLLSSLEGRATRIAERRRTDIRSLAKQVGGELDWITRRALEKDRARRYQSASELAADVERYLNDDPVQAGPPTTAYLLRKLATRHKTPLVAGAASIVLLIAFGVAMAIQANRIAREAERANRGEATAEQVSEFLVGLFKVSNPTEARGNTITAREILQLGAERIEKELKDQPVVQARLMHTMGDVYEGLGLYEPAASLLEQAVAVRERELGDDHADVAASLDRLGWMYQRQARYDEAESLMRRALAVRETALGEDPLSVATSLTDLAALYWTAGRNAEAEPLYQRGLAIREKELGPEHSAVGASLNSLAILYKDMGRYAEAEPLHRRALAIHEKELGEDHPSVGSSLNNLAVLLGDLGRYAESEPLYQRALAIQEKALGENHPFVANSLNNLAMFLGNIGNYRGAEPLHQRALAIREQVLGLDHPDVATSLTNLANVYSELGKYAEAEPLYERATSIRETKLAPDHPHVAWSLHGLANLYRNQNRLAEAKPLYERTLAIREKGGADHPEVAWTLNDMAKLHAMQGRADEAERAYQRALSIREQALAADHPDLAETLTDYAVLLRELDRGEEAVELEARVRGIRSEQNQ